MKQKLIYCAVSYLLLTAYTGEELKISRLPEKNGNVEYEELLKFESEKIAGILSLDPFLANYDLSEKYNTPLKKNIFLKSEEAKEIKKNMKDQQVDIIKQRYYIDLEDISEYNLKTGSFMIHIGYFFNNEMIIKDRRFHIEGGIIRQLDIRLKKTWDRTAWEQLLFISVQEKYALKIEEGDVKCRIVFNIAKTLENTRELDIMKDRIIDVKLPRGKNVEIQFVNTETGGIIYSRKYK